MDVAHEEGRYRDNHRRFSPPVKKATVTTAAAILLVAISYFVVARLSLLLALEHTNATPVWPATGIALAAVLALGYGVGAGIFAGAFFANLLVLIGAGFSISDSVIASVLTASGNTLEAIVGSALIRRFSRGPYPFESVRDVFVFVVFGALLSTIISSTVGVTSFCLAQGNWTHYSQLWLTWWLGDTTGAIVVVPLCLAWTRLNASEWKAGHIAEALILWVLLSIVSYMVFVGESPLKYLTLPVLLWIVLRFGLFEVSLAVAILSGLAIWGTIHSASGLNAGGLRDSLLSLQSYICVVALTALFVSAVVRAQKRTENELRSEKIFADTVIDSIPGAFYVLDSRGRFIRWNHFLEEINESRPEDLDQRDSLRNVQEEDRERLSAKIAEAFEKGHSESEGRILTKSGVRYFLFTGRRAHVEGVPYVVGSGIDITARKLAELKLEQNRQELESTVKQRTAELTEANAALAHEIRECTQIEQSLADSEKQYRDLVQGANSVILRWTKEGRITFANRFAQQFFGYSEEEIIGRNIIGSIVPLTESSGRDLSSLVDDLFKNPEAYVLNENENIRKNGERVWVSWTNRPIVDSEGRLVEMLSVGNDITLRKRAEFKLKSTLDELAAAKARAEAADHLKSAFLATMSHELRTPLNSIIGFTGIMLKGYVGPLNDEQAKQMSMVRNSANHLLSLINDVLDISKIEAGQLQVSFDSMNLRSVIEQSVQSVRLTAEKKGLFLSMQISPDVGTIVSDQRRVEQILLNLLSNAIKFTEQGGVSIECKKEAEGSVTVTVTDTGIGIREEDMTKLFKAFQQLDSGIMRRYEGTGLGLYICQKLVELLGGRIWVSSAWNEGTTFSFTLPDRSRS